MKMNLKNDIWIDGFDGNIGANFVGDKIYKIGLENILYIGLTDNISNKILKEITTKIFEGTEMEMYKSYYPHDSYALTPLESVKSACNNEYCLIYKKSFVKVNLKSNIWIAGFETPKEYLMNPPAEIIDAEEIIYGGETNKILEEMASNYCDWMFWDEKPDKKRFYNYGKRVIVSYPFETAIESIQSACKEKYCLIYKIKDEDES